MTSTWEITNGSLEVQRSSSPGTALLMALASGHFRSSTILVTDCPNASCAFSLGVDASISDPDEGGLSAWCRLPQAMSWVLRFKCSTNAIPHGRVMFYWEQDLQPFSQPYCTGVAPSLLCCVTES